MLAFLLVRFVEPAVLLVLVLLEELLHPTQQTASWELIENVLEGVV
jgi:hypothetical protein